MTFLAVFVLASASSMDGMQWNSNGRHARTVYSYRNYDFHLYIYENPINVANHTEKLATNRQAPDSARDRTFWIKKK